MLRKLTAAACLFVLFFTAECKVDAGPREELLRLVPDDASVWFVVNNLREEWRGIEESPLFTRLAKSPLLAAVLREADGRRLVSKLRQIESLLGVKWERFRDDIIGDCVVGVYYHKPRNGEKEQGIVLVQPRDAALLKKMLDQVNRLQQATGQVVRVEQRRHRDTRYTIREEKNGKRQFYAFAGNVFVLATHERLLIQVLEQAQSPRKESFASRQAQRLTGDVPLGSLWINARAFDREFQAGIDKAASSEKAALTALFGLWQALDVAVVTADLAPNVELSLTLMGDAEKVPSAVRQAIAPKGDAGHLARRLPPGAAVRVICRSDFRAAVECLEKVMTPEDRREFRAALQRILGASGGVDFFADVLPYLGPDFGCAVFDGDSFPQCLFALRVGKGREEAPADEFVLDTLHFAVRALVTVHNASQPDPLALKTRRLDGGKLFYLVHKDFPKGVQPCFTLKDGYLLIATSPEAVDEFKIRPGTGENGPVVEVRFDRLRTLIAKHRQPLMEVVQRVLPGEAPLIRQALESVGGFVEPVDRLRIEQEVGGDSIAWRLRVIPRR